MIDSKKINKIDLHFIIDQMLSLFSYYETLDQALNVKYGNETEFTLSQVEQVVSSKKFIQKLCPYMNSLLTSTNIKIILNTIRIFISLHTRSSQNKTLQRIKSTVNVFTMYQLQKNCSSIQCNLTIINEIFAKIGLIVSEQQFITFCQSNPKIEQQKQLQISDILFLAVQIQTIEQYKRQFLKWLSSQQYEKKVRARERGCNDKIVRGTLESSIRANNKKLQKIHIRYMKSKELLQQMKSKGFEFQKQRTFKIRNKQSQSNTKQSCQKNQKSFKKIKQTEEQRFHLCNQLGLRTKLQRKSQDNTQLQKNILNGVFIRHQILEQLQKNQAVILPKYQPKKQQNLVDSSKQNLQQKLLNRISSKRMGESLKRNNRILESKVYKKY